MWSIIDFGVNVFVGGSCVWKIYPGHRVVGIGRGTPLSGDRLFAVFWK